MKLNVKEYANKDIIRILREYASLTQKELASELKKNVRTVQRYEAGELKIDLEIVRSICELCDLSLTIESKPREGMKKKNKNEKG